MLGDGRLVRRQVDQIHGWQKLLVNLSEDMDCRYFPDHSDLIGAKETEEPGAEDISGETNPFETAGSLFNF